MAAANGDDVVLSDDTDGAPDEDELVAEKEILNEDVPEVPISLPGALTHALSRRKKSRERI